MELFARVDIKKYVDLWTGDAAKQLAIAIDTAVLAGVYADADATNQGHYAGAISANINLGYTNNGLAIDKTNVVETILKCEQCLDENNIPDEDRYIIVPMWMKTLLLMSDLKAVFMTGDSKSPMRNGLVGPVGKFTVYESNLLSHATDNGHDCFEVIFGSKYGITFATQLLYNSANEDPFGFGMLYKGLQVYGYKVVKAPALGWLHCYQG